MKRGIGQDVIVILFTILIAAFVAVIAVCLVGCSGGVEAATMQRDTAARPVTFLSLNIANGAGAQYNTPAERAIQAAFIASLAPDVVGMQEVDVGVARSGGGNTAAGAMGALAPHGTVLTAACAHVDPSTGAYNSTGSAQVGVGLWVSGDFRVSEWWTVPLDYTDRPDGDGWPRCSLLATVTTPAGRTFSVAVTHLETGNRYVQHVADDRRREVQETVSFGVDVLLGDMNALGDEIRADIPSYSLCAPAYGTPGWIDQAWTTAPCTGRLVPTHGASDHPYAALAVVTL